MGLRTKYHDILERLQDRIDIASRDWVEKADPRALMEYNMLVEEVVEIKEAIIRSENKKSPQDN